MRPWRNRENCLELGPLLSNKKREGGGNDGGEGRRATASEERWCSGRAS